LYRGRLGITLLFVWMLAAIAHPTSAQLPEAAPTPGSAAVDELSVSPRGAFFRSLVFPGWGQVYVGSPGRGAVYFSLASSSLWMSYVARRQQGFAKSQQEWLRETGELEPDDETGLYVARTQQFEDWTALTVFLFFFAGADAYVSAYLSDFDERMGVVPGRDGSLEFRASIAPSWLP